jgi:transcriptional regulator NrdR family protein
MANTVIKKDGSKEPFDADKIKYGVSMAAAQAGLTAEETEALADKAAVSVQEATAGTEEVQVTEIREKILSFLDMDAPKVAEAWRSYEATK